MGQAKVPMTVEPTTAVYTLPALKPDKASARPDRAPPPPQAQQTSPSDRRPPFRPMQSPGSVPRGPCRGSGCSWQLLPVATCGPPPAPLQRGARPGHAAQTPQPALRRPRHSKKKRRPLAAPQQQRPALAAHRRCYAGAPPPAADPLPDAARGGPPGWRPSEGPAPGARRGGPWKPAPAAAAGAVPALPGCPARCPAGTSRGRGPRGSPTCGRRPTIQALSACGCWPGGVLLLGIAAPKVAARRPAPRGSPRAPLVASGHAEHWRQAAPAPWTPSPLGSRKRQQPPWLEGRPSQPRLGEA
mmetsp:Transcript_69838/g.225836  ORF Transcript_69838/g.225836 Transcript_69838/m.225836 type:complete len:300 (-) Transcript_69838:123-1022(-)